ncbi:hypothetical protein DdX_01441 [Ditylenchus destructor]|uniref:Uncharacterized protein n=1 Tax=Ditylenchus destructor TaxID=166010 RepID=A0AAD4RDX2_9BILA|nr:hypothetical protein DdX_01441 [Ditylenchus destructor]
MEELRNFNGYDLYDRLINYTDEQFEDWLRYLGLLYPKNSRPCPKCNSPMTTRKVKDADKYPTYRCNNYKCRHETGFFVDTFFAGLHYPLKDVLHVSYMWCRTWQKFKARHKNEHGTHRSVFNSYISDFIWRRLFGGPDAMYYLWEQIKEQYPLQT